MADTKISQLPELAETPDAADLFTIVDDPAGTPASKRITVANVAAFQDSRIATFTNKTINSNANTLTIDSANTTLSIDLGSTTFTGTTAQFNLALSDGSFATLDGTETLTNKTISSANNTITINLGQATVSGTTAQFNAALTDGSFTTIAGNETLTNKTIDGDNNTLSNLDIGLEVDWASANDVGDRASFEAGDKMIIFEAGVGLRKIDYNDLPGSGGVGIFNVVEDTSPQLGGMLDVNSFSIGDGTRTLLAFTEDPAAVNFVVIENEAANNGPIIKADGTDTNIDLVLTGKGTGNVNLKSYNETVNARGSVTGAQNIDYSLGNVVTATIGGATTFSFTNPPPSGKAGSFTLIVTNASTNITWPTSVDWAGGTEPTWTATGVDIITFLTTDGGTTWLGFAAGLDMK